MAAKKSEESRQGLIIALVVFVLLSIGLGVATFYGFSDQQRLDGLVKDERNKAKKMQDARDWEQFQNLILKSYMGHVLKKEDNESLQAMLPKYEGGQLGQNERADFDNLNEKLKKDTEWDKVKNAPGKTLFDQIKTLQTDVANLTDQKAKLEKKSQEDIKKLSDDLKAREKDLADSDQKLKDSKAELAKLTGTKAKEFQDALASIEKLNDEVDKIKKMADNAKDENKKSVDKLNKNIKELEINLAKAREQIKPLNVVDYDVPKGKVIDIVRGGGVVYINMGSADRVKPQLTFSIYGVDSNGKAMAQRKGSLEVTNVIEPHLSQARITELTDGNRDPVIRGDLLFNPVWSPTLQQHVAVAGLIDLTGEGTDNTEEFIRNLKRQGIVVDAYVDLKDLTVKGSGMSLKTTFLVLGDAPEFDSTQTINTSDVRTSGKLELQKRMSEMQTEAAKLGVPVIPFRRFLAVIGYPMPRVLTTRGAGAYLDSSSLGSAMRYKDVDKSKVKSDKDKQDKEPADKNDKEPAKPKEKADKEAPKEKDAPKDKESPKDKEAPKDKEK
jgi:hypothetical protein